MRKSWNLPAALVRNVLRLAGDQGVVVDLAAVLRFLLQREIEIGQRQRRVLHHDLVHQPFADVGFGDRRSR